MVRLAIAATRDGGRDVTRCGRSIGAGHTGTWQGPGSQLHRGGVEGKMIGEAAPSTDAVASLKDRHEFLSGILKDTYNGLVASEFKQGGFLAIVMGWIVTSDNARELLS